MIIGAADPGASAMAPAEQWKIGDVTVTKVIETEEWQPLALFTTILPGASRAEIEELSWLSPTHLRDGAMSLSVHSYLIRTPERKFVVDTGVGNAKPRKADTFSMLDTPYMDRFRSVWSPDEVDGVICTHLHLDHVGWNTTLADGEWRPTFPNARYYFVHKEYEHWAAYAEAAARGAEDGYTDLARAMVDGRAVFEDSVAPVAKAGLVTYVDPDARLDPCVRLVPTHGHTPGHVCVLIESRGESAVIAGDLMHTPCQLAYPEWSPILDTDPEAGARARRAFLDTYADSGTLVLGTHFGTPSGSYVTRHEDSFRMEPVITGSD